MSELKEPAQSLLGIDLLGQLNTLSPSVLSPAGLHFPSLLPSSSCIPVVPAQPVREKLWGAMGDGVSDYNSICQRLLPPGL